MNRTHGAFWSWFKFSLLCNHSVSLDLWTWFLLDLICPCQSWSLLQYCCEFLGSQNLSSHSCRLHMCSKIRLSQVWVQKVRFEKTKKPISAWITHLTVHTAVLSWTAVSGPRFPLHKASRALMDTWTFNITHTKKGIWLCVASFCQKLSLMGVSVGCVLGLSFEMMHDVADDCIRRKDDSASHILHPKLVFSYTPLSSVPHSTCQGRKWGWGYQGGGWTGSEYKFHAGELQTFVHCLAKKTSPPGFS